MKTDPPHDSLDDLLYHLPAEAPPVDLAANIQASIRRQQRSERRRERWGLAFSALLAVVGAWLVWPALAAGLSSLALPGSGLPLLVDVTTMALAGLGEMLTNLFSGVLRMQDGLSGGLSPFAWLGLSALGLSALLALNALLPRIED